MPAKAAIVVDTSVAIAAGSSDRAGNPPAPACRAALDTMRNNGLRVAMSREVQTEWRKHLADPKRAYALRWLGTMTAQKALVIDNSPWTQGDALVDLAAQHLTPAQATAVRKDLLITGLAMATDRRVLSLDDTQRRLLCTLSTHLPTLCELYWANPQQPTTLNWLEAGAPELPALQVQST